MFAFLSIRSLFRHATRYAAQTGTLFALGALSLTVFSSPAWAAGATEGNPWLGLLWKTINTLILLGILFFAARKPIGRAMVSAAEKEKEHWDDAQYLAQCADADLKQQKERLQSLEREMAQMREDMQKQLAAERENLLAQAKERAKRIEKDMLLRTEQEAVRLRRQIHHEMVEQALALAEQKVRRELSQEKAIQVIENSIAQVEAR